MVLCENGSGLATCHITLYVVVISVMGSLEAVLIHGCV